MLSYGQKTEHYGRETGSETSDIALLVATTGTVLTGILSLGAFYCKLKETLQDPINLISVNPLQQIAQMPSEQDFRETVFYEMVKLYGVT